MRKNNYLKTFLKRALPVRFVVAHEFKAAENEMRKEKEIESKGLVSSFLRDEYKKRTGFSLDLEHPLTLTQKQQWLKLYGVTPHKIEYSDKYLVRKYIQSVLGDDFLVPILLIDGKDHFDTFDEIDFSKLPNAFVIQCNHGSGMTTIVPDKSKLTGRQWKEMALRYRKFLKIDFCYTNGFEYFYHGIRPTIFFTKYLGENGDLPDYKVMCFDGKPEYFWIDTNRFTGHRRLLYNLDFSKAPFTMNTFPEADPIKRPEKLDEMIDISRKLSQEFDYVRVDFYLFHGKLYFGELTFSSGSGYELPNPVSYDRILGDLLILKEATPSS